MSVPLLSFITVCKGRLHHLQQTLPYMARQSNAEVIVVDYGCPQGTAAWVRSNFDTVRVLEVADDPGFCVARARNLGARVANGDYFCFIDADVKLMRNLGAWFADLPDKSGFFTAIPRKKTGMGTIIVSRKYFDAAVGYDEAFRGWGGEDIEFRERVLQLGCPYRGYPSLFIEPIEHGDEERSFAAGVKALPTALRVELLYRSVKRDISALLMQVPALEMCKKLMAQVRNSVLKYEASGLEADRRIVIRLDTGLTQYQRDNFSRTLIYLLTQREHSDRGNYEESQSDAR
jgi:hypothetical protein